MDENKNILSFATSSVRKRPRNRAEWEVQRKWEIEQGASVETSSDLSLNEMYYP